MASLSICMPSNRPLVKAKRSIDSVFSTISDTDIEFVISDNSGDQKKKAYIQGVPRSCIRYIAGPITAFDNWKHAVTNAKGQYVVVVSDDDIILSTSAAPFEQLRASTENVVGARPGFVVFNEKVGLLKASNFGINGPTASERIKEYFQKAQGMNSTLFSAWRKDVLMGVYDAFSHHPTRGEYADWAIVLALLSTGSVINETSTVFFYDNNNWYGDQDFIKKAVDNLFVNAGLMATDSKHLPLFQAIDSYILINRKNSPLSLPEKRKAGNLALTAYLKSYLDSQVTATQTGLEAYLAASLKSAKTVDDFFLRVRPLLANMGLLEKYENFYYKAVGTEWIKS